MGLTLLLMLLLPAALYILVPKEALPYIGIMPQHLTLVEDWVTDGSDDSIRNYAVILVLIPAEQAKSHFPSQLTTEDLAGLLKKLRVNGGDDDSVRIIVAADVAETDRQAMVQFDLTRRLPASDGHLLIVDREGWVRGVYASTLASLPQVEHDVKALWKEDKNPFAGRKAYQLAGLLLTCHPPVPAGPGLDTSLLGQ